MAQDRPRLMEGKTQAGTLTPVLVTASGKIQTDTAITLSGDIQIGAVEIKDATAATRLKVGASTSLSGGNNAIPVVNLPHTIEFSLLSGVTVIGSGTSYNVLDFNKFTIQIISTSVSTGGSMVIQSSNDDTNFADIATVAISASGTDEVAIEGRIYKYLRADLRARTDGTYTVKLVGGM